MVEIYLGVAGFFGVVILVLLLFVDFSESPNLNYSLTLTKTRIDSVVSLSPEGLSILALFVVSVILVWRFVGAYRRRLLSPEAF